MTNKLLELIYKIVPAEFVDKIKQSVDNHMNSPHLEKNNSRVYCTCDGTTYLLKVKDKIVARACIHNFTWYGREIRHLFVEEKYRRKGYALLMNKLLIEEMKVPFVFCTVRMDNEPSRQMVRKAGFELVRNFISSISKTDCEFLVYSKKKEDYLESRNTVAQAQENM